jgi:hypothetical protein
MDYIWSKVYPTIKYLLLFLFVGYYCSITLFFHAHLVHGEVVVYCLNDIIKINFLQLLDTMKQALLSHSWYGTARQSRNPRCSCQIPKQRVLCEGYQYRQCVLKGIAWS